MKTVAEIRRHNLATLVHEAGGVGKLSQRIGHQTSAQVSQWLHAPLDSKTGKPRNMSDISARRLEHACGKIPGWMDHEQEPSDITATRRGQMRAPPVPLISWEQAAREPTGGSGAVATERWVEPIGGDPLYALQAEGDSMAPDFFPGDIIIVDPTLEPRPDDYVVARTADGAVTLKRLVRDAGDWYLQPSNVRYPQKPIGTAQIIGVVTRMVRNLR